MASNGSFYQNGLPLSTLETGLGNVPTGAPVANKASSSFYLSGTAYTQANPTLAAASATAAAASAAAAAASAASIPGLLSAYALTTYVDAADALKAPLASPALSGVPTAPTATVGTNTTQLATTAFVLANGGAGASPATVAPLMDGTAAVGTSLLYARQDHVHPTDTSLANAAATTASLALKAPLASPAFTGTPTTSATPAALDNSLKLSTTAYADAAVGVLSGTTTTALGLKAPLASPTFTGTPVLATATGTSLALSSGSAAPLTISNTAIPNAFTINDQGDVCLGAVLASDPSHHLSFEIIRAQNTDAASTLRNRNNGASARSVFHMFAGTADDVDCSMVADRGNGAVNFAAGGTTGGMNILQSSNDLMAFYTNNTKRMTLSAAGGLSSGTVTDPGAGAILANASIKSQGATAGIGYATGAGAAITQLTSRSTGVTINSACGAITLFNAPATSSWTFFTVTNSAVAATDVIHVCAKSSGGNGYSVIVTLVANGSFQIGFSSVIGAATDSPVFNFAVIKAVNS